MYYAYYNSHGIGTRHVSGGRVGHIRIFETAKERDEWVSADKWDGFYRREALTHKQAFPLLVDIAAILTNKSKQECRELGTTWMLERYARAHANGVDTAQKYGLDW